MRFNQVNPEKFVEPLHGKPANGRGAWTRTGIGFDYRYMINPETQPRIGTVCERSLDHWAVGAGTWAIQSRLIALEYLPPIANAEWGIFGPKTEAAVSTFQQGNLDPAGKGVRLAVDGTVGRSDARALFTPLIKVAQADYHIPDDLLLGETNHESRLDPGALGYFIYYGSTLDYRGVDRGMSQINSKANAGISWAQAFDPVFSLEWSAKRLREYHDTFAVRYPDQPQQVLWDAAVCAHNNPSAATIWARTGNPPTETAAAYVSGVKMARY
jgi:hypothetical protein